MALGTSLPARIPASSASQTRFISPSGNDTSGDGSILNPWKTPTKALSMIATSGGLIYCRGGTYTINTQQNWSRSGSSGDPVQIRAYPGETPLFTGAHMWLITGDYLRIGPGMRWNSPGGPDLIKLHWGGGQFASNCEIVGNSFINTGEGQAVSVQPAGATIGPFQIWDCEFQGGGPANLDHMIYWAGGTGTSVVANCLFHDLPGGFMLQAYPQADNLIVTCCTFDGVTGNSCMVIGGDTDQATSNMRVVGCIFTDSDGDGVQVFWEGSPGSGNQVSDCIGFGNSGSDFDAGSGVTYTNCIHADPLYVNTGANDYTLQQNSPAFDLVNAAREGYVPVLDKAGAARTTADAGCFAAGTVAGPPNPGSAPVNTGLPVISGVPAEGQTLSTTNGTWSGSALTLVEYAWIRFQPDGVTPVAQVGTASTYHVVTADVGYRLRMVIQATNAYGFAGATSAPTAIIGGIGPSPGPAPVNVVEPSITGSYQVGSLLTASPGQWNADGVLSYGYQWLRCDALGDNCQLIGGATSGSYTITTTDIGHRLRIRVLATNTFLPETQMSLATAPTVSAASARVIRPARYV